MNPKGGSGVYCSGLLPGGYFLRESSFVWEGWRGDGGRLAITRVGYDVEVLCWFCYCGVEIRQLRGGTVEWRGFVILFCCDKFFVCLGLRVCEGVLKG